MTASRARLARIALVGFALCVAVFGVGRVQTDRSTGSRAGAVFVDAPSVATAPAVVDRPSHANQLFDGFAWTIAVLVTCAVYACVVIGRERHQLAPAAVRLTWRRRGPPASLFS